MGNDKHANSRGYALTYAAMTMLAEIYDWFTEGFDTRDLQDAKAMLVRG